MTFSNVPYVPLIDYNAVSAYYLATSALIGNMAATGSVTGTGGLVFTAGSGINVVTIDQQLLREAWSFTINAPEDAIVLINVLNASVTLDSTTWIYEGGITQESVILNMPNASSLALSSTNKVNILAPLASTAFAQGTVDGLLVVGDLSGGGHVMGGTFNAHAIPDPTTVVLLGLGGVVLLGRRKRLLNRHTA
ncbi:MAG: choice-of-anchor A family protein [Phycisphaerales bacterium]|nr:choice-of-anchor A family protein [Phycisphaerales bacterium]